MEEIRRNLERIVSWRGHLKIELPLLEEKFEFATVCRPSNFAFVAVRVPNFRVCSGLGRFRCVCRKVGWDSGGIGRNLGSLGIFMGFRWDWREFRFAG